MQRRPSTQDVTWLLDLNQNNQLDLNPSYQRRSVWTPKDKRYFLDTVFRNYPSPAIFLHKTVSELGKATYHVVDGKQRIQTILAFSNDDIRIGKDFGDLRLDGKKWSELGGETDLKQRFWNYQVTVEFIDLIDGTVVNEVFDRLNRNARKLTRQELRHAKYDGWLIKLAEDESEKEDWQLLRIVTTARTKRMVDTQFISELLFVVLENKILGFDQDELDELYAKYDEPAELVWEWNEDDFSKRFAGIKKYLIDMEGHNASVTQYAKGFGHFYSLWAVLALSTNLPDCIVMAGRYAAFMQKVETLASQENLDAFLAAAPTGEYTQSLTYLTNSRGASTDLVKREGRLTALRAAVL